MKPFAWYFAAISLVLISAPLAGQENPFRVNNPIPPTELVLGRTAKIKSATGGLEGELLSVSGDSLWVLSKSGVFGMALGEVQGVDVRMHNWTRKRALTWNLVAGLGSAIAMTAACSSVDDMEGGCGTVFLSWSLTWALVGGIAGAALAAGSNRRVLPSHDALRPYVRYPQGLPDGARPRGGGAGPGGGSTWPGG
jgi:hypothetical protein